MYKTVIFMTCSLLLAGAVGCGTQVATETNQQRQMSEIEKSKYILSEEPDGAVGVIIAREDFQDQDEIVLVGRIGGQKNPWIKGLSAFTVIDAAMAVVANGEESGGAEVCLEDCCASLRADCTTLVKIVDEQGMPLEIDARDLLDAKENDMVVVKGTIHRNQKQGIFNVAATGVYVRR